MCRDSFTSLCWVNKLSIQSIAASTEKTVEDWSYLKFPSQGKIGYTAYIYRVGRLTRLNIADGIATLLAI